MCVLFLSFEFLFVSCSLKQQYKPNINKNYKTIVRKHTIDNNHKEQKTETIT